VPVPRPLGQVPDPVWARNFKLATRHTKFPATGKFRVFLVTPASRPNRLGFREIHVEAARAGDSDGMEGAGAGPAARRGRRLHRMSDIRVIQQVLSPGLLRLA
jgi:hypothetical protein